MATDDLKVVLIIDDHEDGRDSLALLLEHYGYVPFLARNSMEGLNYLKSGLRPCVILLDLIMAGDGWHFRAEQMQDPELAKIPVIVGSGFNQRPEFVAPELEVPAEQVLLKPLELDVLLPMLRRFCGD